MAVEEPLPKGEVRRQRLNSSARRASILSAASRVFERTGDLGSTTTKMIAQEAGINEAVLYRHFSSKEEIFYASVVEPLHLPIDAFLRRAQPPAVRMTRAERLTFMTTVMSDFSFLSRAFKRCKASMVRSKPLFLYSYLPEVKK